jgi:KDO2-lipid IV(A) lauroyltransferase
LKLIQLRRRIEYLIFRAFACLIGVMNVRQTTWVADRLADVFVGVLPRKVSRYAVAESNLKHAFGQDLPEYEVQKLIHGMWSHLFRMVAELVQSPRYMHLENCRESIVFRDREQILRALGTGRPIIFLSGHFGNWEVSTTTFGMFGVPMGVIARALDNPYLHEWFKNYREATGHQMILKKGGFDDLLEVISSKGCVGLLADQDAGQRGLFVDFFGQPASTFKSIALLAKEYDAMICVGYARRLEDNFVDGRWSRYEVGVNDVIDPREYNSMHEIREITQRYTLSLENAIRLAPEQYFWVHRRWKSQSKVKKQTQAETTPLANAA